MIDFKELLEYCQAEAICSRMIQTETSVWRKICREYSKLFHTPLQDVMRMDPEHVILNVYEEQASDMDIEDFNKLEHIMDTLRTIEDPNYESSRRDEQDEFDRKAEQEEEERIKAGRPVYVPKKKTLPKKPDEPAKKLPTGGMVNLDYLSKIDSES